MSWMKVSSIKHLKALIWLWQMNQRFDHHWVWLNKCIGYNNYRVFFAWIISYTIYNSTFLGIILMIIIKFSDYSDFENVEVIVSYFVFKKNKFL